MCVSARCTLTHRACGRTALHVQCNPDLVERMQTNAALNAVDMATFYTPGPKGYTDYPTLAPKSSVAG
jgi:hypothetical protein